MLRSESMAYPQPTPSTLWSKIQYCMRHNSRAVVATIAFLGFVLILSSDIVQDTSVGSHPSLRFRHHQNTFAHFGGAIHPGYFSVESSIMGGNTFRFAAVTDLDQLSKVEDSKKPLFYSLLLPGHITRDALTNKYSINFDEPPRKLYSKHNEAGRGMELSELTIYNDRLLSFDDRTGDVFELLNKDQGKDSYVVPRLVITEGDGETDKGMKWEWSTVKNGELYLGSMGKEYTNPDGSIANTNNLWIAILNSNGQVRREDWSKQYNVVRKALGATAPGYIINEAILWSPHMRKWVFMPRRVSSEKYDEVLDERRGSNKVVLVDEHFENAKVVDINMKNVDPLHGFSSIAFVPGTQDKHVLAIRSVEEDCTEELEKCKQRSYFMVLDVTTGEVLLDEVKYNLDVKFEGVEFVDINTPEPIWG